jgi:proline iminopeptidase
VAGLILRGVFLITARELAWFYGEGGAAMLYPDAWEQFLAPIPPAERDDIIGAYHRRLTHPDRAIRVAAAQAWSRWEGDTMSIRGPAARPGKFDEDEFSLAFARIECHYFVNDGFMPEDGWLLTQVDRLRRIPCAIIQGRFDIVTPMDGAWKLKTAWPEAKLNIVWDAGHASTEPGIVDALVRATDAALDTR